MSVYTPSSKQCVFLVFADLGLGGVQTKMISLANTLVARGVECWIFIEEKGIYPRLHLLDKRVKVVISLNVKVFNKRPFYGWRFMLYVAIQVCIRRPSSIFVSLMPLAMQLVIILSKLSPTFISKVIINEDTFPSGEYQGIRFNELRKKIKQWSPRVRAVVAVSHSTYNDLKNNFLKPSATLVEIPNWSKFIGNRMPSGIGRDIDVLYAGRLDKQKQPLVMVDVFTRLIRKISGIKIRVYGEGSYKRELESKIQTLNLHKNISLLSPVDSIEPILKRTKVFIFTSLYEGLPFVGIEAMKNGAIVACLDAPGLRDMIIDYKNGIRVPSTNQLAQRVVSILGSNTDISRLRRDAYVYARKNFSEKNADSLMTILLK